MSFSLRREYRDQQVVKRDLVLVARLLLRLFDGLQNLVDVLLRALRRLADIPRGLGVGLERIRLFLADDLLEAIRDDGRRFRVRLAVSMPGSDDVAGQRRRVATDADAPVLEVGLLRLGESGGIRGGCRE